MRQRFTLIARKRVTRRRTSRLGGVVGVRASRRNKRNSS